MAADQVLFKFVQFGCGICGCEFGRKWSSPAVDSGSCLCLSNDGSELIVNNPEPTFLRNKFAMHCTSGIQSTSGLWLTSPRYKDVDKFQIPVHTTCLSVAEEFIKYQLKHLPSATGTAVASLVTLHQVLVDRFTVNLYARASTWYLRKGNFQTLILGIIWNHPKQYYIQHFTQETIKADPTSHPDITAYTINMLQKFAKASERSESSFTKRLHNLPGEIRLEILKHLYPFTDVPTRCTRLLTPHEWYQLFRNQNLIPWLWDVDMDKVDEWARKQTNGVDWEQFVRELSSSEATNQLMFDCMMAADFHVQAYRVLSNRRRIWYLLAEMEVGDARETSRYLAAMEDYKCMDDRYDEAVRNGTVSELVAAMEHQRIAAQW